MDKIENKVWKSWPEVPFIESSLCGAIRTRDRVVSNGSGTYIKKGRILKQYPVSGGYLMVHFRVNGKNVYRLVHRLVAETFLPNPNNLPQVNHKNCNRADNRVSNLEWCDASYNMQYREKHGKSQGQAVFAINLTTLKLSHFSSQMEASRKLEVSVGNLNEVIKGHRSHTHGYWFTNADSNAVEIVRAKFGDSMANKVAELMKDVKSQSV